MLDDLHHAALPNIDHETHQSPSLPLKLPGFSLRAGAARWLETNGAHDSAERASSSSTSVSPPSPADAAHLIQPDQARLTVKLNMAAGRRTSQRGTSNVPPPVLGAADTSRPSRRSRSARGSPSGPSHEGEDGGYGSSHSQSTSTRATRNHPVVVAEPIFEEPSEAAAEPLDDNMLNGNPEEEGHNAPGGRPVRARKAVVKDSEDEDEDEDVVIEEDGATRASKARVPDDEEEEEEAHQQPKLVMTTTRHGRITTKPVHYAGASASSEESDHPRRTRLTRGRKSGGFVVEDEEYDAADGGYGEMKRSGRLSQKQAHFEQEAKDASRARRGAQRASSLSKRSESKPRSTRNSQKHDASFEGDLEEEDSPTDSNDEEDLDLDDEGSDGVVVPRRKLRQRQGKVDYFKLPPLEAPPEKRKNNKGKWRADDPYSGLPANMTGAQWAELYPEKNGAPDSDSDDDGPNFSTPRKAALFGSNAAAAAAGFGGAGGMFAGGAAMDLAGGPNNLGKVVHAALADTDPLGVSSSISFDSVGGLGAHIQQLKEMVSLPLLYPEVFERFNITPPRGVLFHGPPGTGKTLLARALAASCSTEGQKISFFMRKGADCLSKWVGEAERQLRLLFEEAKACQPSIIFFDEIDGLAPVRSSKQEQIHASIVSTLLALMDGMDGRGQVIVIGATNRPDAIDPALRRPGRFDREFYFPLPNLEGRRKILDIHTNGWNPPIEESFKDELAMLTKGYGGADLRALCTEAALNAVQRTYPQIYKTNERLVINPQTIDVTARDFIISQKNLIPSSARATSSAAAPIPPQLEPLLHDALDAAKLALTKVLPDVKKANVLEEAEWEDEGGGFEKEKMMQAFESLRVFRPRMLIFGQAGMGQGYVGAAVLHHLEGFHVQTLDLATLVSDSSRTMEAACVQLFVEAKRHKPSILFVPSLVTWCASVTDTVRSTIKGLLDGLDPSDPILLLAVVDGPLSDVPADVRSWFGFVKGNRVHLTSPRTDQREAFFNDVLLGIQRPPNEFPDAMPRRKRVLEKLAIAPPPPPKAPTQAEIQQLLINDQRQMEYLKWKLGPLLNELKKRYKRFTRSFYEDWRTDDLSWRREQLEGKEELTGLGEQPYHNTDLDSMHMDLYNGVYWTPDDFLNDILRIQSNAEVNAHLERDTENPIKAGQMVNHAKVMLDQTFDHQFRTDCAKMAERMKGRVEEQQKNAPPGTTKGRGKGKGKAVNLDAGAIAAAAAAGGGGRYGTRSHKTGGPEATGPVELEDPTQIERRLKRNRKDGEEDSQASTEDGHGPSKRATGSLGINGLAHEVHPDDDADGEAEIAQSDKLDAMDEDEPPIASTSAIINGDALSTNGNGGGFSSFADLLNPSARSPPPLPLPDLIPTVPELPGGPSTLPGVTYPPMQVGAPSGANEMAFAAPQTAISDLPAAPSSLPIGMQANLFASPPHFTSFQSVVSASALVPHNSSVRLPEHSGTRTTFVRDSTPVPGEATSQGAEVRSPAAVSPIAVEPPTPEPLPDFDLDASSLKSFSAFLRDQTDALNVDQLEQLRAACYDIIWRGRKAWDRTEMLRELDVLAREYIEEVESLQG
ncbi:ATPase family AAA domain-containing protein 2, partial [Phenoliferia sp. Uapishka_3]